MKNWFYYFVRGNPRWIELFVPRCNTWGMIGGAAVSVIGGAIVSNNNKPGTPTPRNLGNELGNIGGQYPGILNNFLGGTGGFSNNYLGNLGTLSHGTFNQDAFFAARPDAKAAWDAHFTNGENQGWTVEQFAKAFDGDALNKYTTGGLPALEQGLNTATRTNNLQDAYNLGGAYTALTRGANQDYYSALNNFTRSANDPLQPGQSQMIADLHAAQGFGTFNPSGLYANTNFNSQNINPSSVSAPGSMLNVNSRNVFAPSSNPILSQLNQQAMNQGPSGLQTQQNAIASQLLSQGGNLSPSELRNVQQSSRSGFAARGLDATNASVVDEAMQTDAAQRQRLMQNVGIAQGVQNQGISELGQQQQFGLGVGNQNFGYGQLGLQGQQANQGANLQSQLANQGAFQNLNGLNLQSQLANQSAGLSAQQSNQGANLQAQGMGLQAQIANQGFGLNSFNANLNSQMAQQQALMQSAQLANQQQQAQWGAQAQAVQAQRAGFLDPFAAITGSADTNLFGQILGANQSNQATQSSLYGSLLGYGQDLNNTNYNANAASGIAGYNANQSLYGGLISAGGNIAGQYLGNYTSGYGSGSNGLGAPTYQTGAGSGMNISNYMGAMCWVAREVYGTKDNRWMLFRDWLLTQAPRWFRALYIKHGEKFAGWLHRHPALKKPIRYWMDSRIETLSYS